MKTSDYWNSKYRRRLNGGLIPAAQQYRNNPVLIAAREYFGDLNGKRLIDLGCGNGEASLFFAENGATVYSIDFSEVAIKALKDHCDNNRIANIIPMKIPAMGISEIEPVDFVFGSMILHHIEPFDKFVPCLRKSLLVGGRGFFLENNAFSPLLIWFRRNLVGKLWVPKQSDEAEFPLMTEEIDLLRRYFDVEISNPELMFFRLIPTYLLRGRLKKPFELLDKIFYRVPYFRRRSYTQILHLSRKI